MSMWIISPGCSRWYRRDADRGGDLLARHALTAQAFDARDGQLWRRLTQPLGPRAAVVQALQAFAGVATNPFTRGARANACGFTGGLRRLPAANHFDQPLSTERRQTGILMDVHPALSQGSLKSRQPQLPRTEPDGQPIESSHLEHVPLGWNQPSGRCSRLIGGL